MNKGMQNCRVMTDLFTKSLAADKFEIMRKKIGVVSLKDLN